MLPKCMRRVCACLLSALLVASLVGFLGLTFMRGANVVEDEEFEALSNATTIPLPGYNEGGPHSEEPLWIGRLGFWYSMQLGCVLLAALATLALRRLQSKDNATLADGIHEDTPKPSCTFMQWVRRVLFYPLPPAKLWLHMCGGVTVLDALLVALWAALSVFYTYEGVAEHFKEAAEEHSNQPAEWAMARIDASGIATGYLLRFNVMALLFPVARSSFLKPLFKMSAQALNKYHRWMGLGTVIIAFAHSTIWVSMWGAEGELDEKFNFKTDASTRNMLGLLDCIIVLIMAFTATPWFRANYFKVFYVIHVLGFVTFVLFAVCHSRFIAYWILPSVVLYGLDRAFRYWQWGTNWTLLTPSDISADGSIMSIHLTWKAGECAVRPGQTVYLRVPAVSFTFTHPFSVAGISSEGDITHVTLHVRMVGAWTKSLQQKVTQGKTLRVQVEGPYETQLDYLSSAPAVVLIAGGTGVTPVVGLLRHFAHMADTGAGKVPQVHFLWTSRHLAELRLLGSDLLAAACQTDSNNSYAMLGPQDKPGMKPSDSNSSDMSSACESKSSTASGWLYACLHYTGLELEIEAAKAKLEVQRKPTNQAYIELAMPPSSNLKGQMESSTGTKPVLAAHPAKSTWVHAASTVLAFGGAFAGFLCANYYTAKGFRTREGGFNYGTIGVLQLVCIAVGIMLPVIILQVILHVTCKYRNNKPHPEADPQHAAEAGRTPAGIHDTPYLRPSLKVLPDYTLAPSDSSKDIGGLQLARGRPNTAALLQKVREQYAHLRQMDVVVAGPDGLCESVQQLCQKYKAGGPELVCRRVAYHT